MIAINFVSVLECAFVFKRLKEGADEVCGECEKSNREKEEEAEKKRRPTKKYHHHQKKEEKNQHRENQ